MKIIYLLLCILPLTTARVQPRIGVNDVFDGVEGVMYDIPEYEDPELSIFKLIAGGIMPVVVKSLSGLPTKNDKQHYKTDDIKKGLDTVITQLQEAKNKLENGNNAVYLDIDKSVLSLENLKHHLYLDLHPTVVSSKTSATPYIMTKGSSDKSPTDQYSVLKASIKKYLSSDFPVFKSFSLDIPSGKSLSYYKFPHSSFDATTVIPYLSSEAPVKQSSVDGVYSTEQPSETISSKDENSSSGIEKPLASVSDDPLSYSDDTGLGAYVAKYLNLPSSTEQPLNLGASTEHSAVIDKSVYEFKLLDSAIPPVEVIPNEKEVKTDVVDDVSPAKPDQAEQGDKTLIRKKWSMKISTLVR